MKRKYHLFNPNLKYSIVSIILFFLCLQNVYTHANNNAPNNANFTYLFGPVNPPTSDDFITTWQTTTPNESITIPTTGSGYNYDVDCGDGNITTGHTGDATHIYVIAGTYTVAISVDFPRIYFNNTGDKNKIISIVQWGTGIWSSMENAFFGCTNLDGNAIDTPDLSIVTNMTAMFYFASSFNGDVSSWNVSNVTDMPSMFESASTFNQDVSNWNVSNVTNMSGMFGAAISFNGDVSSWNVGSVLDMSYMFNGASSFNSDISNWNVGNVIYMHNMFTNANSFNGNVSSWNVGSVTNMQFMFQNATSFDQDIGAWDVEDVTNMSSMFSGVTLSTTNYDSLLIGWDAQNLQSGINFNGGSSLYCYGETARTNMINNDGWTITDGGKDPTCLSCAADFSATPTSGTVPLNVQFTDLSTGNPTSWGWDFDNDGVIESTSQNPSYTYVNPSELEEGKIFISPYKFDSGFYEISGFWDWNDSESWDDFEPYIAPTNIDVTGYEQPKVNIFVVDKSQPNDDGWCLGSISYSGADLGSHHIYLDITVIITAHSVDKIKITDNPHNLLNSEVEYFTSYLSPEDMYVFEFFWDINDNGVNDDGEPRGIETPIVISPGLPTIINTELKFIK